VTVRDLIMGAAGNSAEPLPTADFDMIASGGPAYSGEVVASGVLYFITSQGGGTRFLFHPASAGLPSLATTPIQSSFSTSGSAFRSATGGGVICVTSAVTNGAMRFNEADFAYLGYSAGTMSTIISHDVCWDESRTRFVACGATGNMWASTDSGANFNAITSGVATSLYGITYQNSVYVAVGSSGVLRTSPDCVTWTARTSGVATRLRGAAWSGSVWVVVGESGVILTSTDLATWTPRTSGTTNIIMNVYWSATASKFVATMLDGTVAYHTSPDGITWTAGPALTPPGYTSFLPTGAGWTGTDVVTFASNTPSPQLLRGGASGASWTQATSSQPIQIAINAFSKVIGVQSASPGPNYTLWSSADNAATWTQRQTIAQWSPHPNLAANATTVIAAGLAATIYTSPDGITWTARTNPIADSNNTAHYLDNSISIMSAGSLGKIAYSTNFTTWTLAAAPGGLAWTAATICGLFKFGATYYAIATSGILSSPDGVTWTCISNTSIGFGSPIGSGKIGNYHVIATTSGAFWVSLNCVNWTNLNIKNPYSLSASFARYSQNPTGTIGFATGNFAVPCAIRKGV
jgi:hypothetical protein